MRLLVRSISASARRVMTTTTTTRSVAAASSSEAGGGEGVGVEASKGKTGKVIARFWKAATLERATDSKGFEGPEDDFRVRLDGRVLKGPDGAELRVAGGRRLLAALVAAEWERLPRMAAHAALPMSSLAARAAQLASGGADTEATLATLRRYIDTDAVLYFQPAPPALAARQDRYWLPVIRWAERRFAVPVSHTFALASVAQSPATLAALDAFVRGLDCYTLAAFERAVLASKSFLLAAALVSRAVSVDFALSAARVEVDYQTEKWGQVLDGKQLAT
ncbi:ATP synthase complex assembly protein atp12 [Physocladia obscura]|uniref:ATP synthase complex assembly protein atp12 n=1 Tax=Physocladia obscura TaxID=109957 RepID=A0AAD5SQT4_9FUNG|nr:ATP synthase complex assembly protein atp12 [Physocladia obscura]